MVGVKFSKEKKLETYLKNSQPGPEGEAIDFLNPVLWKKKPTGVKFATDNKVNILDQQFSLGESRKKPGPGRYNLPTDFC